MNVRQDRGWFTIERIILICTLFTALLGLFGLPFRFGQFCKELDFRMSAVEASVASHDLSIRSFVADNARDHTVIKLQLSNVEEYLAVKTGRRK